MKTKHFIRKLQPEKGCKPVGRCQSCLPKCNSRLQLPLDVVEFDSTQQRNFRTN